MNFSSYMTQWLYGPNGYYTRERDIGKKGDFYTAVSTSIFFGGSIAKRLISTIESGFLSSHCCVVEIGAHKGYLLADIIQFLYTLKPSLLETLTFYIVEPFEANQLMQERYFKEAFGETIKLLHLKSLDELSCKEAFFVANEIFDAFACEVIYDDKMLVVDENSQLIFCPIDAPTNELAIRHSVIKGEIAIGYESFARAMAKGSERYEFVTFDYGDKVARNDFSLRVYAEQKVYPFFALTPLVADESLREPISFKSLFGKSDITYDVNFSHLIDAYEQNGALLHQYTTQMTALVEFGLIELLEMLYANVSKENYEKEANKVKILIDPAFMGERFKMACFRKNKGK
ncbi:MAG: SAM-dependent methyltransferase [Sulfurospirillaceae bacterium]|nr:SAM-dependent methyltransferase [Sulfurospirillaceae bacterium]